MFNKLDHIGIAVKDIEPALKFFRDALNGVVHSTETIESMKIYIVRITIGGVTFELIKPLDGEEHITRFILRQGEGIHHLCFEVEDVSKAQQILEQKGYSSIWQLAQTGSEGRKVNFFHPKQTHGVLIEVAQKK